MCECKELAGNSISAAAHSPLTLSSSLALFPFHIDEASVILRLDKCVYIYECSTALCERRGKKNKERKRGECVYVQLFIYLFIYRIWQIYIE